MDLTAERDNLERVKALVDFEMFRPALMAAVARADQSRDGGPAFDQVLMFKALIRQAMNALSDECTEFLIKDPLSSMRFLALGLADVVPDANTIWTFREALKEADAIDRPFRRFNEALHSEGFLAMSGQIVDATIVAAPKQCNTIEKKKAIKEGRIPNDWKDKRAKLAQKDRDAGWTVKYSKAKPREDGGMPAVDLAIPAFGYKNHVSVNRGCGLIRTTHAAAQDGARLKDVLDPTNTASDAWADTAYRSATNEAMLVRRFLVSPPAGPRQSPCASATRRYPKSAARPSTCLHTRKDRWASSRALPG
jgi:transposase, IS5 family